MEEGQGWGFTGARKNLPGIQEVNPVLQGFVAAPHCLHLDKGVLKQQDTKGLKISPSYLVRNPTLAPQLGKTHKTPPSSRDEGHLFLHGLESSPKSSLQTSQEA